MESKIFSFKVDGITLAPVSELLSTSPVFNRKEVLKQLKDVFKEDGYEVDERSLNYKIKDGQLFIEGLAVKKEEAKSIGFMTGR
ncbi:hypothetical protein LX99_00566 [Mucilaginibacter oryzae]|uniref:Uncharacterized protein n=1 Tax=Mucilaginibacter oryzae TaxID=468058 RepID=A0A316HYG6_9SPHI|nr:hypothetical protein [Mucilaginibacter oryzae]PWK80102.1 hypothetical protein LX99_00566 [Mucilaginibacter oryzae]